MRLQISLVLRVSNLNENISPAIVEFHCKIHQNILFKISFEGIWNTLGTVVKAVNFTNARSLSRRQFYLLFDAIETQFIGVLTFNDIRWLSQVFHKFELLFTEIRFFFQEKVFILPNYLKPNGWLILFLCDFTQ